MPFIYRFVAIAPNEVREMGILKPLSSAQSPKRAFLPIGMRRIDDLSQLGSSLAMPVAAYQNRKCRLETPALVHHCSFAAKR